METEGVIYVSYVEAVFIHVRLMRLLKEERYGVFDRKLIESALARAGHTATYEDGDLVRQAATLCLGLIKNHPLVGGNKRTATAIVDEFLHRNGLELRTAVPELVELVLAVEAGSWEVDEIDTWLRNRVETKTT